MFCLKSLTCSEEVCNKVLKSLWTCSDKFLTFFTESEKVLNVLSILRVTVMIFLIADHLEDDIFKLQGRSFCNQVCPLVLRLVGRSDDLRVEKVSNL